MLTHRHTILFVISIKLSMVKCQHADICLHSIISEVHVEDLSKTIFLMVMETCRHNFILEVHIEDF